METEFYMKVRAADARIAKKVAVAITRFFRQCLRGEEFINERATDPSEEWADEFKERFSTAYAFLLESNIVKLDYAAAAALGVLEFFNLTIEAGAEAKGEDPACVYIKFNADYRDEAVVVERLCSFIEKSGKFGKGLRVGWTNSEVADLFKCIPV